MAIRNASINSERITGMPKISELSMQQSIDIMKEHILDIIVDNEPSIYLFGSVVLEDFKLGWSDIDVLCLMKTPLEEGQAEKLVNLRQELLMKYPGNLYFRSFEGGFLTLEDLCKNTPSRVVYWGTSGQRITDNYYFDVFSKMELLDSGRLLYGRDIRDQIPYPSEEELKAAVDNHYQTIRKYAVHTGRNLYSAGWLLDIARCLYTLRTGEIIAKTAAGEWALTHEIVPDKEVMLKVLSIRRDPMLYKDEPSVLDWLETIGPQVQEYADLLEAELKGNLKRK